jgi:hypothetical protein
MNVNIAVELPSHAEERLRAESGDLSVAAREAFAIELFRRGNETGTRLDNNSVPTRIRPAAAVCGKVETVLDGPVRRNFIVSWL